MIINYGPLGVPVDGADHKFPKRNHDVLFDNGNERGQWGRRLYLERTRRC